MGINLNFGVNGYVAIKDMNDRELYRQPVQSRQEADQWIKAHKASVQGWDFIKSSIIPMRVNNFDDLKNDLFLPTFVNHASKINNFALKVIASIIAIAWDIVTFPIRLIALPIRLCAGGEPRMPVEELIKDSPYFAEAKKNGIVKLVSHVVNTRVTETFGQTHPDITDPRVKDLPFRAEEEEHDVSCEVYLKALSRGQRQYMTSGEWKAYQRIFPDGLWNQYNGITHPVQTGEPC